MSETETEELARVRRTLTFVRQQRDTSWEELQRQDDALAAARAEVAALRSTVEAKVGEWECRADAASAAASARVGLSDEGQLRAHAQTMRSRADDLRSLLASVGPSGEAESGEADQHEHVWRRRQNVTTKGYAMPPYEVCECGAARPPAPVTSGHVLTEYGTTSCPVEHVRADVDDDGVCSACGAPVPSGGREEAFVELLPPDVGHNLRHFGPETAHVTGSECHCHPEPIPHAVPSEGQADGPVSESGHRWPCTRFYTTSSDRDPCTCGQADGEGEDVPTMLEMQLSAELAIAASAFGITFTDAQRDGTAERLAGQGWTCSADVDEPAARLVLSREALRERLDGHWLEDDTCICGWSADPQSAFSHRTQWRDHLADVLAGGEQR